MIRTEERNINGTVYSVTQIAGSNGLKAYKLCLKLVLPVIGSAADCAAKTGSFAGLGKQLSEVISGPDGEALERMLFVSVRANGQKLDADNHWPDHYQDYHQLLAFALDLNFGAVFRDAAGKMGLATQRLGDVFSELRSHLKTSNQKSPDSSPEE